MVSERADLFSLDEVNSDEDFAEAQTIAFFESVLFYRNVFERSPPLDLVGNAFRLRRTGEYDSVPTWIIQGEEDLVCPPEFAAELARQLKEMDEEGAPTASSSMVPGELENEGSAATETPKKARKREFEKGAVLQKYVRVPGANHLQLEEPILNAIKEAVNEFYSLEMERRGGSTNNF